MDKYAKLSLDDDAMLDKIGNCFASSLRRKILAEVSKHSYSIMELAKKFNVPLSTMSTNIKILKDADLVMLSQNPNKRGNEKIVSLGITLLEISLNPSNVDNFQSKSIEIPIGSYSDFNVEGACGIGHRNGLFLECDKPEAFYMPNHVSAQIIWFTSGYLEYTIPTYQIKGHKIKSLGFSLEICSECPNYKNDWMSEITFSLNGVEVCSYISPGDFGGRQGKLTPDYWPKTATQFGLLKSIKTTDSGTYIDEQRVSDVNLDDISAQQSDVIKFRICVKKDSKLCGGLNLFGKRFGDYPQDINCLIEYSE